MSEATAVHRQMLDAINARDLDALRRLMHDDYSYTGRPDRARTTSSP
jgi:DNA-binding GntR family transcriptional regulator